MYKLKERYALLFVLTGLPFVALAFWPNAVGWIAEKLKMQYTTLALIGVSVFLFLMVFELLSIVSVQDQKITALAQLVGILMEKQKMADPEHRAGAGELEKVPEYGKTEYGKSEIRNSKSETISKFK